MPIKQTGIYAQNKTVVEFYNTPEEFIQEVSQRHNPDHILAEFDVLDKDNALAILDENHINSASWRGLSHENDTEANYEQLWGMFKAGTEKTDVVSEVNTAANDFHNTMGALKIGFVDKPSPAGPRLDPNKFCHGDPNCFITRVPVEVGIPMVNIVIDASVLGNVEPKTIVDRGKLIAKAIVRAELGGYRTRVSAMSLTHFDCSNVLAGLVINLKMEDEPMNYSRVLYPFLEPSFLRGVSFTWRGTLEDLENNDPLDDIGASSYRDFTAAQRREMYDDLVGENTIVFCMGALCQDMSHDEAEQYIEDQMQTRDASCVDGSLHDQWDYTNLNDKPGKAVLLFAPADPDEDDDWEDE